MTVIGLPEWELDRGQAVATLIWPDLSDARPGALEEPDRVSDQFDVPLGYRAIVV